MLPGRRIIYAPAAAKALMRIDRTWSNRIRAKVAKLADDPTALSNQIIRLVGSPYSRLRVGNYRVIFNDDLQVLTVFKVGHRSDIYN